jgi:eukaryotic-like serine/threonine-protein kinase
MTKSKPQLVFGILSLCVMTMSLTACGGVQTYSWPGLTVSGQTAFLAYNQTITAINVETGQLVWKFPDPVDNTMMFYSNPLFDTRGNLSIGTYEGVIVQLAPQTGTLLWKKETGKTKIYSPVLELKDSLVVSSEDGNLHFVNPSDGSIRRSIDIGKSTWGKMATDGTKIYIATLEHWVFALDAATGQTAWSYNAGTSVAGGVTLADGKLLMGTFGSRVIALDAATGALLWETPADNWVWSAPIVDGGTAFFADLAGIVRAVSLADGKKIWSVSVGKPVTSQLVFSDGVLFVGTDGGKVHALSSSDGSKKWEATAIDPGGVHGTMVAAGDRLLVTLTGGTTQLEALSIKDGSILWKFEGVK